VPHKKWNTSLYNFSYIKQSDSMRNNIYLDPAVKGGRVERFNTVFDTSTLHGSDQNCPTTHLHKGDKA